MLSIKETNATRAILGHQSTAEFAPKFMEGTLLSETSTTPGLEGFDLGTALRQGVSPDKHYEKPRVVRKESKAGNLQ